VVAERKNGLFANRFLAFGQIWLIRQISFKTVNSANILKLHYIILFFSLGTKYAHTPEDLWVQEKTIR
jgi:hypothetical protein